MESDRQLAELFDAVSDLPEEQREPFLAREYADRPGLVAELRSLLRADARVDADGFLHGSALDLGLGAGLAESARQERTGHLTCRYRILEFVGEGGMGEVYLAEDDQLNRAVAIKLLKGALKTRELRRRFDNEARILAQLNDEHIARLLDVGTTDDGVPFLVMEYVEGLPIDEYCAARALSVPERLKLFRTVCSAVQHAHQNLIVHRDLKPNNVLVTAAGTPKLLDFGIAKLLDAGQDTADPTVTLLRVMTPRYASPEQIKGEAMTTATDIYSLGVVLYELLTGRPPYRLDRWTNEQLAKAICEEEPEKPSAALDPAIGNPRALRDLRGDLDNIVLMALRKPPERRYATVEQFSEDVRRHLVGLPVAARKDTLAYRASKFVARNRLMLAAGVLLGVVLIGGIVSTTVQRNRAEQQRGRAEAGEAANRRLLYAAQMSLAYQAWESANTGRALDLLDLQVPKLGQPDLRGFEWNLLWRLTHERSRTLPGTSSVQSVSFSPDGDRIAVGGLDGHVRVWQAGTRTLIKALDTLGGVVEDLAYSSDGRYLAAGCENGWVGIWHAQTLEPATLLKGHPGGISALAFSPDSRLIATAGSDRAVKLWSIDTGELKATLKGHTDGIVGVAFSPDGRLLATGSQDHTVKLWDVASGTTVATLTGHSWWVLTVAFSPRGDLLATSGSDGEIRLWDVASHQQVRTIHGDGVTLRDVKFSPDGRTLAVAAFDGTVRLYDTESRVLRDQLRAHTAAVVSVGYSPDGRTLVSGGFDGVVRVWDLAAPPDAVTLNAHTDWVSEVAFAPDGRFLASASKDATVKVWEAATGHQVMTLPHPEWVNGLAFSPDGAKLATADDDRLVRVWNAVTGQLQRTLSGHDAVVECVAFSPDNRLLASGSKTGDIKLWDAATGALLATLRAPNPNLIWGLAFSPDGTLLAAAEGASDSMPGPHPVTVWDVGRRSMVAKLTGHTNDVRSIAFAPDGRVLASGSLDGTIKLWDVRARQEIATLKGQRATHSLRFSTDGKRLVTGGQDRTVKIWDVGTRQELCTLTGPSEVLSVAFSPDGTRLIAGSKDGNVRLWFAAPAAGVARDH